MSDTRTPDDDTELIEALTPKQRSPRTTLVVVLGTLLGLGVLAAIVVAVLTVSDESDRPAIIEAPLTPTSLPAPSAQTTAPSATPSEDQPVPAPVISLPPITATANTIAPTPLLPPPGSDNGVRERLHELFPRLFPDG
ncbi:MAG: hypothetical protein ABWY93_02010 [Mycobacterium sp.]